MDSAVVKSAQTLTDCLKLMTALHLTSLISQAGAGREPNMTDQEVGRPFQEMLRQVKVHKNQLKLLPPI